MRARAAGALVLSLSLAGCGGPPQVPLDAVVSPTALGGADLSLKEVGTLLRDGLDQVPPEDVVTRVQVALAQHGAATLLVPHEGHTHHYTVTWVAGTRTLVFFERTGDGVERLSARAVVD